MAGQAQVLQDFGPQGGGWCQCADAQGTFFFNRVTQQSSETMPPELAPLLGKGGGGSSLSHHQQLPVQQAPQVPAAQPQVLRQLAGGWLQCKDQQGIFYHNSATKQSQNDPPPGMGAPGGQQVQCQAPPVQQAASQSQVLREFPGGWLQCRDAQGIYFHNSATKQSLDQPPPEIAHLVAGSHVPTMAAPQQQLPPQQAPAAAQAGPQVMKEFPGNWLQCKDAQGIFFHNSVTKQSLDNPPPEIAALMGGAAAGPAAAQAQAQGGPQILQQLPGGWLQCKDAQGIFYSNSHTKQTCDQPPPELAALMAQSAGAPQAAAGQATLKAQIGVWQILEDAQGEFYCNSATKQTFDQPPPELLQQLQMQKACQ